MKIGLKIGVTTTAAAFALALILVRYKEDAWPRLKKVNGRK